ncbi:hypothetical protein QVD17_37742 [Tagetes erecta]|uniref:Uncharacterized protein n=1 Tax=Tagetes erecta TaxID=13708 RepID=A0AAD8NK37_TARER|nr:hypothetical protein QVD17_37742 [Tagetes erecta]
MRSGRALRDCFFVHAVLQKIFKVCVPMSWRWCVLLQECLDQLHASVFSCFLLLLLLPRRCCALLQTLRELKLCVLLLSSEMSLPSAISLHLEPIRFSTTSS